MGIARVKVSLTDWTVENTGVAFLVHEEPDQSEGDWNLKLEVAAGVVGADEVALWLGGRVGGS
jgi:hypothetical protein